PKRPRRPPAPTRPQAHARSPRRAEARARARARLAASPLRRDQPPHRSGRNCLSDPGDPLTMATDVERLFHETWLGETQPHEGLTFSVPVLCDGGVMVRLDAAQARAFAEQHTVALEPDRRAIQHLRGCLLDFFDWNEDELHGPERMPDDLLLRVAEEGTELRPTLAIPLAPIDDAPEHPHEAGQHTPASRAGAAYQMLIWELPIGLDLDAPEAETTAWHYPPSAKLERLLRETRVPIGLLSNGETLRLLYCPTGQSTGWISFDVAYMCS